MLKRKLQKAIDTEAVLAAIREAETATSGEIRVSISPFFWGNIRKAAEKAFSRMGMTTTSQHNGILFFIIPGRRQFVILGDQGIHEKVGQEFWEHLAAAMSGHFKHKDFTAGLLAGIKEAGDQLSRHFPYDAQSDVNELPDAIDLGK